MTGYIRMRRHLDADMTQPVLPPGTHFATLSATAPVALHTILSEAYANGFGSVPAFHDWWAALTGDSEFDPTLVLIAADSQGHPIGLAQCWTSGFIKDIAVSRLWHGKGIGEALLRTAFRVFGQRGYAHVDLKVDAGNAVALRLYRRVGMIEVSL